MSVENLTNPYSAHSEQATIWEACVRRDIQSFVAADWSICADDFVAEGFAGWDAGFMSDPMQWQMRFPSLKHYQKAWLAEAMKFTQQTWQVPLAESLFNALKLKRIEITGEQALVHKCFEGELRPVGTAPIPLRWQSIFHLQRVDDRWRQRGFVGYLPI